MLICPIQGGILGLRQPRLRFFPVRMIQPAAPPVMVVGVGRELPRLTGTGAPFAFARELSRRHDVIHAVPHGAQVRLAAAYRISGGGDVTVRGCMSDARACRAPPCMAGMGARHHPLRRRVLVIQGV